MRFYADLHVHSKYARACSSHADLEHMALWGALKGIDVIATGDFTHPAWLKELKEKLVPAESGLFRLREDIERKVIEGLPTACRKSVRFILSVEISTIYKKGDRTRKVHHLIYMPDFAAADRLIAKLSRIGNLHSDGRPILGLDSRHLLEIVLESSRDGFLIPAHIWTPWFSVLGSRSGFDSVDECYGDLAPHVFAVETGLSSDPEMNWRVSSLDRFRMTSSSDAHSPQKLGREATLFDTSMDYYSLRAALEHGEGYIGTVEFFPEEGKYHMDGHRKCNVRLTPEETIAHGGRCPVCGDPVTVGVMHRVEALADRQIGCCDRPHTAGEQCSFVPLPEILGELHGTGSSSKQVERTYGQLTGKLGTELSILGEVPIEDITKASSSLLGEAIARLRRGDVVRDAGYDGEYGVIRMFAADELKKLQRGGLLFEMPESLRPKRQVKQPARSEAEELQENDFISPSNGDGILDGLDTDQRAAAEIIAGPLLVTAGPGSGKTRMLTHRIAHLIQGYGVSPSACLAITFTRRAAAEMRERLKALLPDVADTIPVHSFHSLGLEILREHHTHAGLDRGFSIMNRTECRRILAETLHISLKNAGKALNGISLAKRTGDITEELAPLLAAYTEMLALHGKIDFDDLILRPVRMLTEVSGIAQLYRERFRFISVDEYQDLDALQYRFLRLLVSPAANLCAIGDPHQAIYGFRGADSTHFQSFCEDFPAASTVRLTRNYRSRPVIVAAASQLIGDNSAIAMRKDSKERIFLHTANTEYEEATFVTSQIEAYMGGHDSQAIHSGRTRGQQSTLSFSDFAVLYRTDGQAEVIEETLHRSGVPFRRYNDRLLAGDETVQAMLSHFEISDTALPVTERLEQSYMQLPPETRDSEAGHRARIKLMALADKCRHDPERFREEAGMVLEIDLWDKRGDSVILLTMHAAKGLEFPVVFITGVEDGIIPLAFGDYSQTHMQEERRLFYVAMTRAKDHLYLIRSLTRSWRGSRQNFAPSLYLEHMDKSLFAASAEAPAAKRQKQLALF